MLRKVVALLGLIALATALTGCMCNRLGDLFWGTHEGHPASQSLEENRDASESPYSQHVRTQWVILFDGLNNMHRFWDRHFMNYDWDDPKYY